MKRTVTRWVSQQGRRNLLNNWAAGMCVPQDGAEYCVPIEVTLDDGEPEGKCPCGDVDKACCQFDKHRDTTDAKTCCKCHTPFGTLPCLSDWHKKAGPETRDRVVEGCVQDDKWVKDGRYLFDRSGHCKSEECKNVHRRATLTIHEEPTLAEEVEKFLDLHDKAHTPCGTSALRAALAREKAKEPRP